MSKRRLDRRLYLASRAAGDLNAAQRGRLGKRVAKRYYHRGLIRLLRKAGLWGALYTVISAVFGMVARALFFTALTGVTFQTALGR